MRYVLLGVASEDTIQLFDSSDNPVIGVLFSDVEVYIRKEGEAGYTQKPIAVGEWTDRGGGNYAIDFSSTDFNKLGLFRYQVISPTSAFQVYQDGLIVTDVIPSFPVDPPQINAQTDVPIGIIPDPVYRGDSLTINGQDLGDALQVTIGGVVVPIVSNTDSQIVVDVIAAVNLGDDQVVTVITPGGSDSSTVDVVLNPADIPGAGMVNLYGWVHSVIDEGNPKEGVGVFGRVLDMPNIGDGVGWTDEVKQVDTDVNGYFSISMPRNTRIEIQIPWMRYRREFITPNVATANLFTEIP